MLETLTLAINVAAMAVSLCLGFYLITKSPQSRSAWLAAVTLWLLTALFFNNALSIEAPDSRLLPWLRRITLFSLPFWFNLTVLLRSQLIGTPTRWKLARFDALGVPLAYAASAALVVAEMASPNRISFIFTTQAPLLSEWTAGPLNPLAVSVQVLIGVLALANLAYGRKWAASSKLRSQFTMLLLATCLAAAGESIIALGVWLQIPLPSVTGDALTGTGVILLGFAIAHTNALLEGRVLKRDLLYVGIAIGSLTLFALALAELLFLSGHVFSFTTLILIMVTVISMLMLYDGLRSTLDRFFYQDQYRQLRANLRSLAQDAGSGLSLEEQLQAVLDTLTQQIEIRQATIALYEDDSLIVKAGDNSMATGTVVIASKQGTEISQLVDSSSGETIPIAAQSPLHHGGQVIGWLLLGPLDAGRSLDSKDLMLLEESAGQIASLVLFAHQQQESASEINRLVLEFRQRERDLQQQLLKLTTAQHTVPASPLEEIDEKTFTTQVEDALRRLHDYSYLGEHSLSKLNLVQQRVPVSDDGIVTHIDLGKSLSSILVQAIDKLKPDNDPTPQRILHRQWRPYVILHDSYVQGELNRDIMSKLYIGEGTFNRARRQAIRSIARTIKEFEQEAKRQKID